VEIEHDRWNVADVGVDGVAEQEQLHNWQSDHHGEGHAVAPNLTQLFPGDGPDAKRHAALPASWRARSSRTMGTNASSTGTRLSRHPRISIRRGESVSRAT